MKLYKRIKQSNISNILQNVIFEKYLLVIAILIISTFNLVQIPNFWLYVQSDDFGYIADTAFFAGYNWNPYTGDMTPYYNIGFSIIPSIIFRICNNPVTIYRLLLVYILILQNILLVFIFLIGIRHLRMNKFQSSLIALTYSIGMLAPQNGLYYMSEVPFGLCFVLVVYLLLEAQKFNKSKTKKHIITILCAAITAYSYSVHTRFLVLFVTLCIVLISYQCLFKEKLLNYITFIVSFIVTFGGTYCFVKYVQRVLYKTSVAGRIIDGNDALTRLSYISNFLKTFLNIENWGIFIGNFMSLLSTLTLMTGGLFWILLVITFRELYLQIRYVEKRDKSKCILILSCLISFIGMNILIAINGVTNIGELKWLTFYRYCKPFVGLLVVLGIHAIWNESQKERLFVIKVSFLTLISTGITIVSYIIPRMGMSNNNSSDIGNAGWLQYYFYNNQSTKDYFLTFFLVMVIMSIFYFWLIHKGKIIILSVVFILFSMVLTCSENYFNIKISQNNYQMIDKTLDYVQNNKEKINIPIYFMQGTYSGRLRFALFNINMNYVLSEEQLNDIKFNDSILFSDNQNLFLDMINVPKYCFELDENEYLFTSNEEIRKSMENEYTQLFD